ncbi:hypothetical protein ACJJTC_009599 [Scirpophaga incertulas]
MDGQYFLCLMNSDIDNYNTTMSEVDTVVKNEGVARVVFHVEKQAFYNANVNVLRLYAENAVNVLRLYAENAGVEHTRPVNSRKRQFILEVNKNLYSDFKYGDVSSKEHIFSLGVTYRTHYKTDNIKLLLSNLSCDADTDTWNTPGTSSQPTVALPPPPAQPLPPTVASADTQWKPPKKKQKIAEDSIIKIFKECEGTARQYERERDRIAEELERERIRQRDVELQLQAQWLDFMKEVLKVAVTYLGKRN